MKLSVLISEKEIKYKIKELAGKIKENHSGEKILLLGILKGSFVFMADLIRELAKKDVEIEVQFLNAKSYHGTKSTGKVKLIGDLSFVKGKKVIIIEDIYDTGLTMEKLFNEILQNNPKSIEICVLLLKQRKRKQEIKLDYIGFEIPDKFVVGYGLDYNERFRELPYIGVIENSG